MSEHEQVKLISAELNAAFNAQIGRELFSSNQYLTIAAYFDGRALRLLAKLFLKQANEEREHALKFYTYLADTGGSIEIPAVDAPSSSFESVEHVIESALKQELEITAHINSLMTLAIEERDYAAQDFLRWFVTEQVEEVKTMDTLLTVARAAGERNILTIEAYLVHKG